MNLVTCPDCKAEAPPVWFCETCGYTHEPPSLSIRERFEKYLTENGWTQWSDGRWAKEVHQKRTIICSTLGRALDVQLASDTSKGASK